MAYPDRNCRTDHLQPDPNAGNASDAGTPVTYKPDQFGAPLGAQSPNVA